MNEGLPLPKTQYHFPTRPPAGPVPTTPDVNPVGNSFGAAVTNASQPLARWGGDVAGIRYPASMPPKPPVPEPTISGPGQSAVPGYFKPVDTQIDKIGQGLVEGKPGQVLGGLGEYFTHPVGSAVEGIYGARINAWQREFMHDHGADLSRMNQLMWGVHGDCDDLQKMIAAAPAYDPKIDDLMKQKQAEGDALMEKVQDRLRNSEDGPERRALEDLWKKIAAWQGARDKRVDADRTQVIDLQGRMQQLGKTAEDMNWGLRSAATQTGRMVQSETLAHANPEAAAFAVGMRQYLLGTKSQLDSVLTNR